MLTQKTISVDDGASSVTLISGDFYLSDLMDDILEDEGISPLEATIKSLKSVIPCEGDIEDYYFADVEFNGKDMMLHEIWDQPINDFFCKELYFKDSSY